MPAVSALDKVFKELMKRFGRRFDRFLFGERLPRCISYLQVSVFLHRHEIAEADRRQRDEAIVIAVEVAPIFVLIKDICSDQDDQRSERRADHGQMRHRNLKMNFLQQHSLVGVKLYDSGKGDTSRFFDRKQRFAFVST